VLHRSRRPVLLRLRRFRPRVLPPPPFSPLPNRLSQPRGTLPPGRKSISDVQGMAARTRRAAALTVCRSLPAFRIAVNPLRYAVPASRKPGVAVVVTRPTHALDPWRLREKLRVFHAPDHPRVPPLCAASASFKATVRRVSLAKALKVHDGGLRLSLQGSTHPTPAPPWYGRGVISECSSPS
jgi:hypothetical protein